MVSGVATVEMAVEQLVVAGMLEPIECGVGVEMVGGIELDGVGPKHHSGVTVTVTAGGQWDYQGAERSVGMSVLEQRGESTLAKDILQIPSLKAWRQCARSSADQVESWAMHLEQSILFEAPVRVESECVFLLISV